eukprot:1761031-Rhodomonas_salina.1
MMNQVAEGLLYSADWATKPQANPFVQAMVALQFQFENLAETTNVNLAQELGEILTLPPSTSLRGIVQRLDTLVEPVTRTYATLQ